MGTIAIVIGATGLVGGPLTEQLVATDNISKVIAITRRPIEHPSTKIDNNVVNFDQLEECATLFRADFLFSCLGTTRKQAGSHAAQRRVDLDYQYKAAQLAADMGVNHYLLVSSSGADVNSRNPYLKMKGELEQKIKTLPFKRISIFQPSLLLGSRKDFRIGEKLGSWVLPSLCSLPGLRRFRPVTGQQVAAKMVQVSQQPGQTREWFQLDEIFIKR
ncbi:MAG: short chain dehydrogenase [Gammaproteobacteria bacterium]|nr:MAG: short chain dehydrogenase [Gammaproteobacteria bacterium]RLA52141.1 MAG: short chain dehydrogenase [Gammaproteobacteria bacterium]